MKKIGRAIKEIFLVLLFSALALGVGFWLGSNEDTRAELVDYTKNVFDLKLPGEVEKRVVTREEVEVKLREIGELASYAGEYTVSKSTENSRYVLDNIILPGTTNAITIKCSGLVKVGYRLEEIVPTVDNESFKIYVALPEPEVLDNYVIWDTVECVEDNKILNPIDFAQYKQLISELEEAGLQEALKEGVYEKAEEHLKLLVRNFLAGFHEYEVVFL